MKRAVPALNTGSETFWFESSAVALVFEGDPEEGRGEGDCGPVASETLLQVSRRVFITVNCR